MKTPRNRRSLFSFRIRRDWFLIPLLVATVCTLIKCFSLATWTSSDSWQSLFYLSLFICLALLYRFSRIVSAEK